MSTRALCRVCLAEDARLFPILNTPLQVIYEKITNITLSPKDGKPVLACFLCRSRLHKCHILMRRALAADLTLTQWLRSSTPLLFTQLNCHSYNLSNGLSVSPIEHFSTVHVEKLGNKIPSTKYVVKIEDGLVKSENGNVKCEPESHDVKETEEDGYEETGACLPPEENQWSNTDSEDDLPLQAISNKKTKQIEKKLSVTAKKRKCKREEEKGEKDASSTRRREILLIEDFAREISLTKEQQIAELEARAQSDNYLHSPLKCQHCYRGFIHPRAYENHMRRHDESSGAHSCDICRLRYSSSRQLIAHTSTVHARRYQCHKCSHRAHSAALAREHEKWHNGYTYVCKLCGQTFMKPTSHLTHMRKRHPSQYVCDICGDSFVGPTGLQMHKTKTHTGDKQVVSSEPASDRFCAECDIQFLSVDAWKRHILTAAKHTHHNNEPSPTCKICSARFPSSSALSKHLREHQRALLQERGVKLTAGKHVACDQCPSLFSSRSKLLLHVKRKHLGLKYNKNIVCEVCGKKFKSNASLMYHQRTHTGEKPYQCKVCPKRFADTNRLKIHTRTHTGERPYCCTSCGKRFSQKPALNRHHRVHTGAKPYACQFCAKSFTQSNSRTLHVNAVHLKMPAKKRSAQKDKQTDINDTVTPFGE